jgi:hypothetical protein
MFTFTVSQVVWDGPGSGVFPAGSEAEGAFANVSYNDDTNTIVVSDRVELKAGSSLTDAQKTVQRRFEDVLPDLQTALARQDLVGYTGHS